MMFMKNDFKSWRNFKVAIRHELTLFGIKHGFIDLDKEKKRRADPARKRKW